MTVESEEIRASWWRLPPGHVIAFAAFALVFAASWINPIWPAAEALHHSLTVIAVALLWWASSRFALPLSSLVCALAFLTFHSIAAHWLYSNVPYDHWTENAFGFSMNHVMGWQRNNFDRLVHFSYGILLVPIVVTWLTARRGWRTGPAGYAAISTVLASGAVYEIFEWAVAITAAPTMAEAYNGQQGDFFDSDKDMAIAALGALISATVLLIAARVRHRSNRRGPRGVEDLPRTDDRDEPAAGRRGSAGDSVKCEGALRARFDHPRGQTVRLRSVRPVSPSRPFPAVSPIVALGTMGD